MAGMLNIPPRCKRTSEPANIIKKLCLALFLLVSVLLSPKLLASRVYAVNGPVSNSPTPPVIAPPSPEQVKSYVLAQAEAAGVNPAQALWIVGHESQFGQNTVGDGGKSIGPWQFNLKANPEISYQCADDLKCSTSLALQWIKNGKIRMWSTWTYCRAWYSNCPF